MSRPALPVAYARGVTPGKWARIWAERHPELPLELTRVDAAGQAAALRDGAAVLAFVRLPIVGADALHVIPLYEERPYVVFAKDHALEASEAVSLAELAAVSASNAETRHPFDDDIEMTVQLVAAGTGFVVVPQSVARLYARRDLITRPVTDAPNWQIALAWPREASAEDEPFIQDFIGVVRGRTANSSRGTRADDGDDEQQKSSARPGKKPQGKKQGGAAASRRSGPPKGRGSRGGGSRRRPTR